MITKFQKPQDSKDWVSHPQNTQITQNHKHPYLSNNIIPILQDDSYIADAHTFFTDSIYFLQVHE